MIKYAFLIRRQKFYFGILEQPDGTNPIQDHAELARKFDLSDPEPLESHNLIYVSATSPADLDQKLQANTPGMLDVRSAQFRVTDNTSFTPEIVGSNAITQLLNDFVVAYPEYNVVPQLVGGGFTDVLQITWVALDGSGNDFQPCWMN